MPAQHAVFLRVVAASLRTEMREFLAGWDLLRGQGLARDLLVTHCQSEALFQARAALSDRDMLLGQIQSLRRG
jgi:hypothetical protein